MTGLKSVFQREFAAYFATPLAFVFIVIFLILSQVMTFFVGGFYDRGQADLQSFFGFLPWLYLILIPAIAMRLWAEERKSGTLELLMTLPITPGAAVVGKFLAAWAFTVLALALTFPLWITVNYLGNPDNGAIFAGYVGAALMAGGYLAISTALSALTRNQVVAFVVAVSVCFLFTVAGLEIVQAFFPGGAGREIANFSFLNRFNAIAQGVVDLRDLLYFLSLIGFWLFLNRLFLDRARERG
ncbi:MAG: ABC transporter permease subunit [Rhodothalassiaceae bacterium]